MNQDSNVDNLSAEGVVGFNHLEDGIQVETISSAEGIMGAIDFGVSLWIRQNIKQPRIQHAQFMDVVRAELFKEVSSGVYQIRGDMALLMVRETQRIELVTATGNYSCRGRSEIIDDKGSWKVRFEDTTITNGPGHISVFYNNKPSALDTSRPYNNQTKISRSTMSGMIQNIWFGMQAEGEDQTSMGRDGQRK